MKVRLVVLASMLGLLASSLGPVQAVARTACPAPTTPMRFADQTYVDMNRAGGEPTVEIHPDGTLLYSAHAGTTHVYAPAAADEDSTAFFENYTGQAYIWWSTVEEIKATGGGPSAWHFVPRTLPPDGVPNSGFSDPEFAIDTEGQVYFSEINLVNIAMSKSIDSSRSYELQNFFAQTMTDRQWTEADTENVVYIVGNAFAGGTFPSDPVGNLGHHLYKSKDGGETFTSGVADPGGLGDLQVDKRNGTLYEANLSGGRLSMAAFRRIRAPHDDFTRTLHPIAKGVDMNLTAHWPSIDVDDQGNLYIVWSEDGDGARPGGIWYAYSTNAGKSFSNPILVDRDTDGTDIWPWLAVGAPGRVAIAWLEAEERLPNNDSETPGDHGWRVEAAQTLNGLGCDGSRIPGFRSVFATPDPVHRGTICNGGTVCQAQGIDRRMGDFFTIEIDQTGRMWSGYSDTRQGGMVALPGFVRQSGGPVFLNRVSLK